MTSRLISPRVSLSDQRFLDVARLFGVEAAELQEAMGDRGAADSRVAARAGVGSVVAIAAAVSLWRGHTAQRERDLRVSSLDASRRRSANTSAR